jgi:hypothetical protein
VRPSLSRAVPELLLKISSAEGDLSDTEGALSMLRQYPGKMQSDVAGQEGAVHGVKYAC